MIKFDEQPEQLDLKNEIREQGIQILHNLKLHEAMNLEEEASILRVPGGWIYNFPSTSVFVPYNNEGVIWEDEDEEEY